MSNSYDVIVVGAGIVGAACAAECARSGLKVLVLDRGPIGGGTTATGMGHIVVMDDSEAQFALTAYSRRLWQELAPELPPEVEYEQAGTLWVAADEIEMEEVRRKQRAYTAAGVRADILNAEQVREAEPNLRPGLAGALRVTDDAVIYPPCAARFLLDKAKDAGAEVRTGANVTGLIAEGGVTLADGTRLSAGLVVNATGPWSPSLTPGLPVKKRKGHLVITARYPGFIRHQIVELGYLKSAHSASRDSVAFNVQPRKTGQVLIGSSRQYDADDAAVDQDILGRMLRRAQEYMPGITRLTATRVWTGHRAATPDKLPLIGPAPDNERVWLATGHEGLGITMAPGTGRLVADLVWKRPSEIASAPYAPSRLAGATAEKDETLHATTS